MIIQGRLLKYGDNIDTDVIIPGKYTKTLNMSDLAGHVMEDLDPGFKDKVAPFLVVGKNFGCGSSREQAPLALKHAGVRCIVAKSFARIFYRNAVNIGLIILEADTEGIKKDDVLRYSPGSDALDNLTTGKIITVKKQPEIIVNIVAEGGLLSYLKKNGTYII